MCYPPHNPVTQEKNKLYYGDNYDVLRQHIKDESVDLIYLDPPFNSRQDYNVLFAEKDGSRSASQITAFKDTWEWNIEAERSYEEVVEQGGRVADAMRAFRTLLGGSDMLAYLAMRPRASWSYAASSKKPAPSTSTATQPLVIT
jgi:site-specific DNA-methyltransferase (adenine-specific)